ncbi:MAG: ATP phosphoribosyltransferase regulatory subunit [Ruminococcus sp.]|nr:ATP phosphoribosyltransferase regulatory subunit [Ruminococcus sp.]
MKRYELITPEGTKDLLFDECLAKREIEKRLSDIFKSHGYSEVVTTGIEFYDVFSKGSRTVKQEALYKLTDSKGRLIVLRPDSTIPIARLVATRLKDAPLPLRLYYNQAYFENNALLKGHSDEVTQAGVELIGTKSRRADFEILSLAVEALSAVEPENFRIEIGNVGIFKELVAQLGVDKDAAEQIRYLIVNKNYPALGDLLDTFGDNDVIRALKELPRLFGKEEVFERVEKLFVNDTIKSILDDLKYVYESLLTLGIKDNLSVDLGAVNRIDYYTGLTFKGYLEGIGEDVLAGGRYNHLISEFGYDQPATGFGINVNACTSLLLKNGNAPKTSVSDVIVYSEMPDVMKAICYSNKLAKSGVAVENSVFETLQETKEYALQKGIKKLVVVADDIEEIDMKGGEQV